MEQNRELLVKIETQNIYLKFSECWKQRTDTNWKELLKCFVKINGYLRCITKFPSQDLSTLSNLAERLYITECLDESHEIWVWLNYNIHSLGVDYKHGFISYPCIS